MMFDTWAGREWGIGGFEEISLWVLIIDRRLTLDEFW